MHLFLLLALDDHERDLLDRLYHKYRGPMWYLSRSICGNPALADDAVQASFVALANHLGKLDTMNDRELTAYISTTVRRQTRREMNTRLGTVDLEVIQEYADDTFTLEELVERMGDRRNMQRALSGLTDEYRDILMLRYSYGFSYRHISKALGITQVAARTRKHRALRNLKLNLTMGVWRT